MPRSTARRCRALAAPLGPRIDQQPAAEPQAAAGAAASADTAGDNQVAIVDLSAGLSEYALAAQLSRAFERTGFAVVIGVPEPTVTAGTNLEAAARTFFHQPAAEKFKCHVAEAHMAAPDGYPGYLEPGHSSVANLLGDFSRPPDAVELLTYKDLHYYEEPSAAATQTKPAEFSPNVGQIGGYPSGVFRKAALAHFWAVHGLWQRLCGLAELALDLSPGFFANYFGEEMGTSLQIRNYPRPEVRFPTDLGFWTDFGRFSAEFWSIFGSAGGWRRGRWASARTTTRGS